MDKLLGTYFHRLSLIVNSLTKWQLKFKQYSIGKVRRSRVCSFSRQRISKHSELVPASFIPCCWGSMLYMIFFNYHTFFDQQENNQLSDVSICLTAFARRLCLQMETWKTHFRTATKTPTRSGRMHSSCPTSASAQSCVNEETVRNPRDSGITLQRTT